MGEWEETQFKTTEDTKRKPMTYHVLDCHLCNLSTLGLIFNKVG